MTSMESIMASIFGYEPGEMLQAQQCKQCLKGLTQDASALASGSDEELNRRARRAALDVLDSIMDSGLTSPEIANRVLAEISRITGVEDPYQSFKQKEMDMARRVYDKTLKDIGDDLRSVVSLAALGNSMDFFKTPDEAAAEMAEAAKSGVDFLRDDIGRLEALLVAKPRLAVYLTDNSGEIFFDLPFYQYLAERCGRAVLAVKGGAALNDLTRKELEASGLAGRFKEVADTGVNGAGIDWSRASAGFLRLIGRADLIISKGMANFETVYPRELNSTVFFLFKVKCEPIQNFLSAPVHSFMALLRKPGQRAA